MIYFSHDSINGDIEFIIRENINDYDTELLSSLAYLSIDFIREFQDRIDINKMCETLKNYPEPPVLTDQWSRWRDKLWKFQQEFLKDGRLIFCTR